MNEKIRFVFSRMAILVAARATEKKLDLRTERVERILLVRANFRMGSAVLATPAIFQFRSDFPRARIDFVGSPMSGTLFENLPIDHHYPITRRFPDASWAYLVLLSHLRRTRYDLAVELSGGSSSMGSFIVGLSGARFRVGSRGKRDGWFNVRIAKNSEKNKYRTLPAFTTAMGLIATEARPSLTLTGAEKTAGKMRMESLTGPDCRPVGVFIGGRDRWNKRWPIESFLKLSKALYSEGNKVVVFAGPEEKVLIPGLIQRMHPEIPLVLEPSVRLFASMLSHCCLLITSDSGPMHLSCALGVRTVAIFQRPTFERWGPPASLARIVYRSEGVSADEVLKVCVSELSSYSAVRSV